MSKKKSTEKEVGLIFSLQRSGLKQKEIAKILGVQQGTVSKILNGKSTPHIPVHSTTADRYEYFQGDGARDSGNMRGNNPIHSFEDPVFEEVAFWEEMEIAARQGR